MAVDADKALIRVSKTLLDSPELQAIRTLDGGIPVANFSLVVKGTYENGDAEKKADTL